MHNQPCIGIFDSGVGGLSVWREITRILPQASTLYLADQAHMPYGPRPFDEICRLTGQITHFLLERGAQAIVVACNTISAAALYYLRNLFPDVPFVGMEPAVKPAVAQTRSGVVGVMATQATLQGALFAALLQRYGHSTQVLPRACPGLAEAVEAGDLTGPHTVALLHQFLDPLLAAGIDQLVMGCTHYPFLLPSIKQVVGPQVTVIDPAIPVARQAARIVAGQPAPVAISAAAGQDGYGEVQHTFFTSGDPLAFKGMTRRLLPEFAATPPRVRGLRWEAGELTLPA